MSPGTHHGGLTAGLLLGLLALGTTVAWGMPVEIVLQQGHEIEVGAAAFSPEGRIIASGGESEAIRLWDASSGDLVRTMPGHSERLVGLAFSPNGQWLASSSTDGSVKVWDYRDGRLLHLLTNHVGNWVRRVAFSRDSRLLSGATYDGTVSIWKVEDGTVARTIDCGGRVADVEFTADGRHLLTASREPKSPWIRFWDVSTGTLGLVLNHTNELNAICISRDGSRLAAGGSGGSIHLWELPSGRHLRHWLNEERNQITSLDFNPAATRLAVSGDWVNTVWDLQTGRLEFRMEGHEDLTTSISYSPDGNSLLTGSADATLRIWDAETGKHLRTFDRRPPHVPVSSLAFSPNGRFEAVGMVNGAVRVWDAENGSFQYHLRGHEGAVQSLAFSRNGAWLFSGSEDRTMRVWDMRHGTVSALHPYFDRVDAMGMVSVGGSEGLIASASGPFTSVNLDHSIKLWLSHYDRPTRILSGHGASVRSVSYHPEEDLLVSASLDGTVKLWDSRRAICLRTLTNPVLPEVVTMLPRTRALAVGMADGTVRILDTDTLATRREWKAHGRPVRSMAVGGENTTLATAGADATVALWDWETGIELRRFTNIASRYLPLAFHPRRPVLAFAQRDDLIVHVNASTGETLFQRVLFPDGEWLAWNPARAFYMASARGGEHARVRFENQVTPVYPLAFYEKELRRQSGLLEALGGPAPTLIPKDVKLWWHRYPHKQTWLYAASLVFGAWIISRLWSGWVAERRRRAQEEISRRLLASQEGERKRIAAELHDGLGQNLLIIKNQLYLAQQSLPEGQPSGPFQEISRTVSQTIDEVREISHNLRPYQLDRLGLTKAIQSVVTRIIDSRGLKIESNIANLDGLFSAEEEINLYRIVQESLNNVLKHSDAASARVVIERSDRVLKMSIEDDGRGFDYRALQRDQKLAHGFGLTGLMERVRILNGRFQCESAPGAGTRLYFEFPIRSQREHEG